MSEIKEIRLLMKLQNNRLRELREALGFTGPGLAKAAGISYASYIALENLHRSPFLKDGTWRKIAVDIAIFHKVLPDYLFPTWVTDVKKTKAEKTLDAHEATMLADYKQLLLDAPPILPDEAVDQVQHLKAIVGVLHLLTSMEEKVIRMRFGIGAERERTHREMGSILGISGTRAQQLEKRALGKIKWRMKRRGLIDADIEPGAILTRPYMRSS